MELQALNGCPELKKADTYRHHSVMNNMEQCVANVISNEIKQAIHESPFVSLLIDETVNVPFIRNWLFLFSIHQWKWLCKNRFSLKLYCRRWRCRDHLQQACGGLWKHCLGSQKNRWPRFGWCLVPDGSDPWQENWCRSETESMFAPPNACPLHHSSSQLGSLRSSKTGERG